MVSEIPTCTVSEKKNIIAFDKSAEISRIGNSHYRQMFV